MTTLIVSALLAITVALLVKMLREGLRDQVEIFSLRNLFLAGFIIFQLTSAVTSLVTNQYGQLWPLYPTKTAAIYTVMATAFLGIFLVAYRAGWGVLRLAHRPASSVVVGPAGLMGLALTMVIVGWMLKMVVGQVPLLGILSGQMGAGVLAVACGLAAWAWAPRMMNPMLGLMVATVLIMVLGVLLFEAFGRREILGVLLAFAWGMYFSYWRRIGPGPSLRRAAIIGAAVVLFMGIFSAARSGQERERSVGETVTAMRLVSLEDAKASIISLFGGQFAAANSMWAIEEYPTGIPYDTLHTVRYYVTMPIPRAWWDNKPNSLGRELVRQGAITKVGSNYSLGPGVLGHCATDNPWIALPLYAIGFGLLLRLVDERVRVNLDNPFIVLPAGAALAQILGLARGETGLFLFNATAAMVGGWGVLVISRWVLASLGVIQILEPDELEPIDESGWMETHDRA